MNKSNAYLSVLLAGLLAAAGVQAQSTSAGGSSDLPPKAGEASTQTMGAPNAATTNSPVGKSRAEVKAEVGMRRSQLDAARASQMMGNTRYGVPVGTPATAPFGTPSVFEGGTPQ